MKLFLCHSISFWEKYQSEVTLFHLQIVILCYEYQLVHVTLWTPFSQLFLCVQINITYLISPICPLVAVLEGSLNWGMQVLIRLTEGHVYVHSELLQQCSIFCVYVKYLYPFRSTFMCSKQYLSWNFASYPLLLALFEAQTAALYMLFTFCSTLMMAIVWFPFVCRFYLVDLMYLVGELS